MMKKLNELSGKNPFKVPEDYFEEVNIKIITATSGYDKKIKEIRIYSRLRYYLLLAASVTGFFIISYTAFRLLVNEEKNLIISEIIPVENFDIYLDDIDILTLEKSAASLYLFEELPDIDKADIIDYLLLENIDINDIYAHI